MKGKCLKLLSKNNVDIFDYDVPRPGPGQVLIENDYTAISAGTELANIMMLPNTYNTLPGYSGCGRIIELGDGVKNVQLGDRVIDNWGRHMSHNVKNANELTMVSDDRISSLEASFVLIATFPMFGLRRTRLEIGESAMIIGQGLLGLFALQFAALSGAVPVIVSDLNPKRLELARELGADYAFSPAEDDYVQKVLDATDGKGVDCVVEVTGAAIAMRQALECTAKFGRLSLLGCTRIPDCTVDFYQLVHKRGVTIVGTNTTARPRVDSSSGFWTERDEMAAILKFLANGKFKVKPIISDVVSPAEAHAFYLGLIESKNPNVGYAFDWRQVR